MPTASAAEEKGETVGRVYFPQYRRGREGIEAFKGTLLEHARRLGVEVASECGGAGTCGRCVVRIEKGAEALSKLTASEAELSPGPGERLACQARVEQPGRDIHVFIRDFGDYSIVSDTIKTRVELDPAVRREGDRVVHTEAGDLGPYRGKIYGLAIDAGTTTVVTEVLDLESGESIATLARKNPQIAYGNDVISRIGYTMEHEGGLEELQQSIVKGVNENLAELEKQNGSVAEHVYDVTVVGNSTMRGIFFGEDVSSLGVIPFEPADLSSVAANAADIGLAVNSACRAYGGPLIGGHAGADPVADILACGMHVSDEITMLVDIGTNGEVAVGNRDRIMTASCAAGGAYEGATTKCGVGAIAGAIKNVRIDDGRVEFETIGDRPPVGICGSGLIDLLAEMLRNGIMSRKARIKEDFLVAGEIGINQQDIYQLITAKAGLRVDQDLLMQYYGVGIEEISKMYLAGGFGNFINAGNAVAIGLLPNAAERAVRVGNAALAGSRAMLLSRETRLTGEKVAASIEHAKPNEREPEFAYLVAEKMYF